MGTTRKVFAAIHGNGRFVHSLWDLHLPRLEMAIRDRVANGESFPGERALRVPVAVLNESRHRAGWPPIRTDW